MFEIVLYEPEIPPNTGNIIRLAANTGAKLHLVKPLGFSISSRQLARAGMDYREFADVTVHEDWSTCRVHFTGRRLYAVTTKGTQCYVSREYRENDVFVFGPESRGLPLGVIDSIAPEQRIRIPMLSAARSLNLANAAAVVIYEAWRQCRFRGGS